MPAISVLVAVAGLAMFHSLEPGHAWPVAGVYALNQRHRVTSAIASGLVLSAGHFLSASVFVIAFFLLNTQFPLDQYTSYIRIGAGLALLYLGYRLYSHQHSHDHDHDDHGHEDHDQTHAHDEHQHPSTPSSVESTGAHAHEEHADHDEPMSDALSAFQIGDNTGILGMGAFAFLLGFTHEEGYAMLSFCAGSFDCLPVLLVYGFTVTATITTLVVLTMVTYNQFSERIAAYEEYLPVLSGLILGVVGIAFILDGLGVFTFL